MAGQATIHSWCAGAYQAFSGPVVHLSSRRAQVRKAGSPCDAGAYTPVPCGGAEGEAGIGLPSGTQPGRQGGGRPGSYRRMAQRGFKTTREAAWFAVKLDRRNAPWSLARGEAFRTIASLELLGALVGVMVLMPEKES